MEENYAKREVSVPVSVVFKCDLGSLFTSEIDFSEGENFYVTLFFVTPLSRRKVMRKSALSGASNGKKLKF
jgi:hypothetical protein